MMNVSLNECQEATHEFKNCSLLNAIYLKPFESSEECPICIEQKIDLCKTACNHVFCLDCAKSWLTRNDTCPMCRTFVRQSPASEKQNDNREDLVHVIDEYNESIEVNFDISDYNDEQTIGVHFPPNYDENSNSSNIFEYINQEETEGSDDAYSIEEEQSEDCNDLENFNGDDTDNNDDLYSNEDEYSEHFNELGSFNGDDTDVSDNLYSNEGEHSEDGTDLRNLCDEETDGSDDMNSNMEELSDNYDDLGNFHDEDIDSSDDLCLHEGEHTDDENVGDNDYFYDEHDWNGTECLIDDDFSDS